MPGFTPDERLLINGTVVVILGGPQCCCRCHRDSESRLHPNSALSASTRTHRLLNYKLLKEINAPLLHAVAILKQTPGSSTVFVSGSAEERVHSHQRWSHPPPHYGYMTHTHSTQAVKKPQAYACKQSLHSLSLRPTNPLKINLFTNLA